MSDKNIHSLFEKQVKRTPDNIAVVGPCLNDSPTPDNGHLTTDDQLSYRELNERANQLAHFLIEKGVKPETLVGICVERSVEMIVGILGILKAGGAYVPIDPEYPKERIEYILNKTKAPIVLSQSSLARHQPSDTDSRISKNGNPSKDNSQRTTILLDFDWNKISKESKEKPVIKTNQKDLAYVIFTSGSTGQPKGVMITHSGIPNMIFDMGEKVGLNEETRLFQFASISFDLSVWEIWAPLMFGGALILASKKDLTPGPDLVKTLKTHKVNTLCPTPSLLTSLEERDLKLVRTLIVGGEAVTPTLVKKFANSKRKFFNFYGPTEATVWCVMRECFADENFEGSVPIGKPIANMEVMLLDERGHKVPEGEKGELCVAGIGLARGYYQMPDKTKTSFIDNPFGEGKVYRTGDLARILPTGDIDCLGRIDFQVKIRGHRIELGEIENIIADTYEVEHNVVIATNETHPRLVAYLVPQDKELSHEDFREKRLSLIEEAISRKLPEYMMPSAFMILDKMPLSDNGKIERKDLPKPHFGNDAYLKENYQAPKTEKEKKIAKVWEEVLKIDRVGITDKYTELGGDSLLGALIITKINKIFDITLSPQVLFELETIDKISLVIDDNSSKFVVQLSPIENRLLKNKEQMIGNRQSVSEKLYPISYPQQQMWLLEQSNEKSSAYNETFQIILNQDVNRISMEEAIRNLISRYEVLRTNIVSSDGKPFQKIQTNFQFDLEYYEYSSFDKTFQIAQSLNQGTKLAKKSFDLAVDLPIRAILIKLNEDNYHLYFSIHHIAMDATSVNEIILPELDKTYHAFSTGNKLDLAEQKLQYADFAIWQQDFIKEHKDHLQDYWQNYLEGDLPLVELPLDRPRTKEVKNKGKKRSKVLSAKTTEALRQLSRLQGTTMFMTLFAAYQILLYRYSSQEDFIVDFTTTGRSHPDTQELAGHFVNTLPFRCRFKENESFSEYLGKVKEDVLKNLKYQDLPFEEIVHAVLPKQGQKTHALNQLMFTFDPAIPEYESGWNLDYYAVDNGSAKFELSFMIEDQEDRLKTIIEYNTGLFDEMTIDRMLGHWEVILNGIVENPDQKVGKLPLMTIQEMQQILEWNNTEAPYPKDKCIHELFEEQVLKTPDNVAVVFEDKKLTYDELNKKSNQLAHYLRGMGVGPETLVGICVERSLEMIVGILGVLKAGGAYVPIDPIYPLGRRNYILENTGSNIVLTQTKYLDDFNKLDGNLVNLDEIGKILSSKCKENLNLKQNNHSLAYIIYTSGSTGKPKGVMVEHFNVVRLFSSTDHWFSFSENDVFSVFHSYSFDFTVWEFWGGLFYGGKIVIVPYMISRSPEDFWDLLKKNRVTVLSQTPSAFKMLIDVDSHRTEKLDSLRYVVFGGEKLVFASLQDWVEKYSINKPNLINMYGITETTVHVTYHRITDEEIKKGFSSIIGDPIPDLNLYILDNNLQFVPMNIVGELYVSGFGVSRGYLNNSEKTRERFIENPFNKEERLYKTGDLARKVNNQDIEYIGRSDFQVEIRGHRVEIGEIEAEIKKYQSVKDVAVVYDTNTHNGVLIAYIIGKGVKVCSLKSFIGKSLPQYMIPSYYIFMDKFPINNNGKIDTKALPEPDKSQLSDKEYEAPRTETEKQIAEIWQEVLGIEKIGIEDNFFDLGGNSLLSVQLIAKINDKLKLNISIQGLLVKPTIKELAKTLQTKAPTNINLNCKIQESTQTKSIEKKKIDEIINFTQQDLTSQYKENNLPKTKAWALDYIPDGFLASTGLNKEFVKENWFHNTEFFYDFTQTQWGSIGTIMLPLTGQELFAKPQELKQSILRALRIIKDFNGEIVSFTGLLPDATNYCQEVQKDIEKENLPLATTGQGGIAGTYILNLERLLRETGRNIENEYLGIIGTSGLSITTLKLMLKILPHPKSIIIQDSFKRENELNKIKQEIIEESGFQGDFEIISCAVEMPNNFYNSTLMIHTITAMAGILETEKIKSGTIMVGSSGLKLSAIKRLEQKADIMFTANGTFKAPRPIKDNIYVTKEILDKVTKEQLNISVKSSCYEQPSCAFSALMPILFDHIKPTIGVVDLKTAYQYYQQLKQMGCDGVDFNKGGNYIVKPKLIEKFKENYQEQVIF